MKTGISEGFICPCGRHYQRTVFPNEAVQAMSCPCGGELIHLWTYKVQIVNGDFHMLTSKVFERWDAIRIMDEIRKTNDRKRRMEAKPL